MRLLAAVPIAVVFFMLLAIALATAMQAAQVLFTDETVETVREWEAPDAFFMLMVAAFAGLIGYPIGLPIAAWMLRRGRVGYLSLAYARAAVATACVVTFLMIDVGLRAAEGFIGYYRSFRLHEMVWRLFVESAQILLPALLVGVFHAWCYRLALCVAVPDRVLREAFPGR